MSKKLVLLILGGFLTAFICQLTVLGRPSAALASGCTLIMSPSSEVAPVTDFSTAANVITNFNHARQAEGCTTPMSLPSTFDSESPQQQMFDLFNAERVDRGLGRLNLDPNLLSQISLNHSREMAQYNYFNHPSAINQPGSGNVFARYTDNPAISAHEVALGEDIAAGYSPAADAVYAYMYQDSGSAWGHRHNILGGYDYVGIGVANGGTYGVYYTDDFMQDSASSPYAIPTSPDTLGPSFSPPTIVSGAAGGTVTAQVTNVQDAGACCGAAGVTGVVFYAGQVSMDSYGNSSAVKATQVSSGVWQATFSLPAGVALHAVAVDGSGNYTDCASGASSCGGPPPLAASYSFSGEPSSFAPGSAPTYAVTVTNQGSATWSPSGSTPFDLRVHFMHTGGGCPSACGSSNLVTNQAFALPGNVPPGASATVTVSPQTPSSAGSYVLEYQMIEEAVAWFPQYADHSVSVASVSSAPALAASYSPNGQPSSWAAGQTLGYSVTVTNTGSQTWQAGGSTPVHLGIHFASKGGGFPTSYGSGWLTDQRYALPSNVAPGGSVTLTVNVTAPSSAGSDVLEYEMVQEGVAWFPSYLDSSVAVTAPALAASYTPSGQPTSVTHGTSVTYSITLKNTGSQTWQAGGSNPVHLGVHFTTRGGGYPSSFGSSGWLTDQRFALPGNVAPGGTVALSITVTAPSTTGSVLLEYEMVEEGVAWFPSFLDSSVSVT